jgi:site-specific DNA recombinase
MKEYLSYVRVSTTKQGEHGVSLPEQRDAIERYARDINLAIGTWFEDRETATKQGRPAFTRMLQDLDRRQAAGVLFYKVDRSARNSQDWADVDQLVDRGFEVHFAYDKLVLGRRGDRLTANIFAVLAADYVRNLREEVKKGFYGRLKQGLYPKPAPIGYVNRGKGQPKTIDPVKGPIVRRAFESYATGRFSLATLGEELWQQGLRSRRGQRVRLTTLAGILRNTFYIGLIRIIKTGQTFHGIHEPLVSTAVFEAVQNVMHGKAPRLAMNHDYVFRQLLRCALCGYSLIAERQKGRVYYRCHTRGCPTTSIREDVLDEHLRSRLRRLQFTDAERAEFRAAILDLEKESATVQEQERRSRQLRLAATEDRLTRLTDAFVDHAIDRADFEGRKTTLLLERRKLEELVAADTQSLVGPKDVEAFLELADQACLSYGHALPAERRELIEIFTSNRVVSGRTPRFDLADGFREIENRARSQSGGPPRGTARTKSTVDHLLTVIRQFLVSSPALPFCRRVQETGHPGEVADEATRAA